MFVNMLFGCLVVFGFLVCWYGFFYIYDIFSRGIGNKNEYYFWGGDIYNYHFILFMGFSGVYIFWFRKCHGTG